MSVILVVAGLSNSSKRIVSTGLLQSSVAVRFGEAFPQRGPYAMLVFLAMLFGADDEGRGRFLPQVIRSEAFGWDPGAMTVVALDDVATWAKEIEAEGSIVLYGVDTRGRGPIYYAFPKWNEYQSLKYRKKSHIPPPPGDIEPRLNRKSEVEIEPLDLERAEIIRKYVRRNHALWGWRCTLPGKPTVKDIEAMRLLREIDKITDDDFHNFRLALWGDAERAGFCYAKIIRSPATVRDKMKSGESKFWGAVNYAREHYENAKV